MKKIFEFQLKYTKYTNNQQIYKSKDTWKFLFITNEW